MNTLMWKIFSKYWMTHKIVLVQIRAKHTKNFVIFFQIMLSGLILKVPKVETKHCRSSVRFSPGQSCVITLGNLFTHMCLCRQA